jgi:hypothetical protein
LIEQARAQAPTDPILERGLCEAVWASQDPAGL